MKSSFSVRGSTLFKEARAQPVRSGVGQCKHLEGKVERFLSNSEGIWGRIRFKALRIQEMGVITKLIFEILPIITVKLLSIIIF